MLGGPADAGGVVGVGLGGAEPEVAAEVDELRPHLEALAGVAHAYAIGGGGEYDVDGGVPWRVVGRRDDQVAEAGQVGELGRDGLAGTVDVDDGQHHGLGVAR